MCGICVVSVPIGEVIGEQVTWTDESSRPTAVAFEEADPWLVWLEFILDLAIKEVDYSWVMSQSLSDCSWSLGRIFEFTHDAINFLVFIEEYIYGIQYTIW